jgi:hypothetical protein
MFEQRLVAKGKRLVDDAQIARLRKIHETFDSGRRSGIQDLFADRTSGGKRALSGSRCLANRQTKNIRQLF